MKQQRLERLEALRGFTALYVVGHHIIPLKLYLFGINIGFLFHFGPEAVIVFFVLSGFVIKYAYEKSRDKSFGYYFTRRFIRFYIPLFFIYLLGYLLKCYKEGSLADPEWWSLIGNFFMLQDLYTMKPNVIMSGYMGNSILWSLSYEWWFYMLFFFLSNKVKKDQINKWVYTLTIVAAISYVIYPFFINRIIMYFAIWWIGVRFAESYLEGEKYSIRNLFPYAYVLMTIIAIQIVNLIIHFSWTKNYIYPFSSYPFLEIRHFVFASMIMVGAVIWKKLQWIGFDFFLGYFKFLAPCSYVIYISHHYLVNTATYLQFINNKVIEYTLYILFMIMFSYFLEVIIYGKIKKLFIG
jgi:peptidoglycan/LPS O-acetylase OafA/YrhL